MLCRGWSMEDFLHRCQVEQEKPNGFEYYSCGLRSRLESRRQAVLARLDALKSGWRELRQAEDDRITKYGAVVGGNEWIRLNVGGQSLVFRRSTLRAIDGSLLAAAFGGKWEKRLPRDKQGRVFIDDDPAVFKAVVAKLPSLRAWLDGAGGPQPKAAVPKEKHEYLDHFLGAWGVKAAFNGQVEFTAQMVEGEDSDGAEVQEAGEQDYEWWLSSAVRALERQEAMCEEEEKKLQLARQHFDSEGKFISTHFVESEEDVCTLNVGGEVCAASKKVLCYHEESVLASVFDGKRWTVQEKDLDADGNYFLDVDRTAFDKVLEYLRLEILYEAESIAMPPAKDDPVLADLFEFLFPKDYERSIGFQLSDFAGLGFMTAEMYRSIRTFLPDSKFWLLYRGTPTLSDARDFHRRVDEKGPTLLLVQSEQGYVFGGYTTASWSGDGYKHDDAAFLFTLTNPHGLPPQKLPCQRPEVAICCSPDAGPCFDTDLLVVDSGTMWMSYVGDSYQLPDGQDGATLLTGFPTFHVRAWAVFVVK